MNDQYKINEDIRRYLNGEMTGAELRNFEMQIATDQFLADAIEGYKITAASIDDVDMLKQRLFPAKKKTLGWKAWIYTGIAASLALMVLYYISQINKSVFDDGAQLSRMIYKPVLPSDTIIVVDTFKNDIRVVIPEKNTLTAELRQFPQKVEVPESIVPLHVNKTVKPIKLNHNYDLGDYYRYRSNHLYTYIGSFKVVDYRYEKRIKQGLPEIPSNINNFSFDNGLPVVNEEVTYTAFLEQALSKTKAGNYFGAIDDFNIILEQFPNDQNALFYKAFCMYELNDNDIALKEFDKVLNGRINTFHEESMWYKGLIYKEEKQYAAAEKVLEEIVNDNGYYGVQAKKELDELYKLYLNE
ncbi:MAG: tetratricopeptide repeat protein [Bacteroidales bacterium]|nr:tetratricopeptide repeat protein [Bacteroidales bacterium]